MRGEADWGGDDVTDALARGNLPGLFPGRGAAEITPPFFPFRFLDRFECEPECYWFRLR